VLRFGSQGNDSIQVMLPVGVNLKRMRVACFSRCPQGCAHGTSLSMVSIKALQDCLRSTAGYQTRQLRENFG
jgi:hypothetical protein